MNNIPDNYRQRGPLKAILLLISLSLIAAAVTISTTRITRARIEQNRQQFVLAHIQQAFPLDFNNDILTDTIHITDPVYFPASHSIALYRARADMNPAGVVFLPVVAEGYNGAIELAIGISLDGTITGVLVTSHGETPGIGDRIDTNKTAWVNGFTGLKYWNRTGTDDTGRNRVDHLSGATITSRSIINTVNSTLEYYTLKHELLYQSP